MRRRCDLLGDEIRKRTSITIEVNITYIHTQLEFPLAQNRVAKSQEVKCKLKYIT